MNCPGCNYKIGILGFMLDSHTVVKDSMDSVDKEGDIYVCPMCEVVSFIHGGKLCPPEKEEQHYLELNKVTIERVKQLYRDHRKDRAN